jgi:hypothetical protein
MDPKYEAATIQTLIQQLARIHLPEMLALKQRVDDGGKLTEEHIEFLKSSAAKAEEIKPLLARHPEYHALAVRVVSLYDEITRKALENEQRP